MTQLIHPHLSTNSQTSAKVAERRRDNRLTTKERFLKVLLMASLYFKFKGCPDPDLDSIREFNTRYVLVTRLDSLWIPCAFAGYLWRKLDIADLETKVLSGKITIAEANQQILQTVPSYGHYKGILSDIERILADSIRVK